MSGNALILAWLQQPFLAQLVWLGGIIIFLYVARAPAHNALRSVGIVIDNAMRYASQALRSFTARLRARNREVLLAAGRDAQERFLAREFKRVHAVVKRDLSGYPALNRAVNEQITRIEEDYRSSTEVPPSPPDWLDAIEAVARIPAKDSPAISNILDSIHQTLINAQKDSLETYRAACKKRYGLLQKMMPYWRNLSQTMDEVGKKMRHLEERIPTIDSQMAKYEQILAKTDEAERTVASSFLTQFFISGLLLGIALVAGFVNFHLLALPMTKMVGTSHLGPMPTADVAALIIILLQIIMGIFILESLRVTRLFSAIYSVDDRMRQRILIGASAILLSLALVEASLAYMQDVLAREALSVAQPGATAPFSWIASAGQMALGFILPFALMFVAIPLESFLQSSRTVLGIATIALLNSLTVTLRLVGHLAKHLTLFLTRIYDVLIFVPLAAEIAFRRSKPVKTVELPLSNTSETLELSTLFNKEQVTDDKPISPFHGELQTHSIAEKTEPTLNPDSWPKKADDARKETDLFTSLALDSNDPAFPEKRSGRTITDLLT